MRSDVYTIASILAAITSQQEQIEWWLRCGAASVAIAAGGIAIWQKLRRQPGKTE
jgi:hypothetical protein